MCRYIKFLTAFIFITTLPVVGFGAKWEIDPKQETDNGNNIIDKLQGGCIARWKTGSYDDFYYCGGENNGPYNCPDTKYNGGKKHDNAHWYTHGACINIHDEKDNVDRQFCCCGGSAASVGKWQEVTAFHTKNPQAGLWRWGEYLATKDVPTSTCAQNDDNCKKKYTGDNYTNPKDVAGGQCNQTYYRNACKGETLLTDCDTATSCGTGYAERTTSNGSKRCVLPCEGGKAFKPGTDECIECPTTVTSGIENDECVTCAPNQIYDTTSASCKAKSALTAIANFAYDKCWLCSSNTDLKKCLLQATSQGIGYTPDNSCQLVGTTGE